MLDELILLVLYHLYINKLYTIWIWIIHPGSLLWITLTMFHISHMRLCTWSYYGQSPETQTSNTCLCFNTANYNTDVMSFICFSSLKFYMWQSDISNLLNIRLLPVIIVLMSFKIGLSQVNQQWNLITVFEVRCFDLIFDKQSFIIKETYKAFFSLICSKQVMFWLIFDKQKFLIKETYKTWYQ